MRNFHNNRPGVNSHLHHSNISINARARPTSKKPAYRQGLLAIGPERTRKLGE